MRRLLRTVLLGIGLIAVLLVVCLMVAILTGFYSRPDRWEILAGYRGWVVIRYEDPACPPLRAEGLYLIIPFDAAGHACTSSRMARGWQYTRYEYVAPSGASTELPGGLNWGRLGVQVWRVGSSSDYKEEYSFVGTEDEFNKSWYAKPGR